MRHLLVFILGMLAFAVSSQAKEIRGDSRKLEALNAQEKRAKFNYQMFCQGCHSPEGIGYNSVPALQNSMHRFMATEQGRSFLVQVPGSANSPLSDAHLAELLNWMLREFSSGSKSASEQTAWQPFVAKEVSEYRKSPLFETVEYRKQVLKNLPPNTRLK